MNPIVATASVVGGMVVLALLSKWSGKVATDNDSAAAKAHRVRALDHELRREIANKLVLSAHQWADMPNRNSVILTLVHATYASAILSAAESVNAGVMTGDAAELKTRAALHQQHALREVREHAPHLLP
jgi:hypothetical protein